MCFSAPNPMATGKEKSLVQASSCSGWTWKYGCKCWFMVAFLFGRPLPTGEFLWNSSDIWTWGWCRDVEITTPSSWHWNGASSKPTYLGSLSSLDRLSWAFLHKDVIFHPGEELGYFLAFESKWAKLCSEIQDLNAEVVPAVSCCLSKLQMLVHLSSEHLLLDLSSHVDLCYTSCITFWNKGFQ